MKKKGFTLVELLAVIVILAIIALIAIPLIGNVIEKAKIGALESSVNGLVESANMYYTNEIINGDINEDVVFDFEEGIQTSSNKLSYKGKVENGKLVLYSTSQVAVCIDDNKYYAYKNKDTDEILSGIGTCLYDGTTGQFGSDSPASEATAEAKDVLEGKTIYTTKGLITGTMRNHSKEGIITASIIEENGENALITIPSTGYYDETTKISVPIETIKNSINSLYPFPDIINFTTGGNGEYKTGNLILFTNGATTMTIENVSGVGSGSYAIYGSNSDSTYATWTTIASIQSSGGTSLSYDISDYNFIKFYIQGTPDNYSYVKGFYNISFDNSTLPITSFTTGGNGEYKTGNLVVKNNGYSNISVESCGGAGSGNFIIYGSNDSNTWTTVASIGSSGTLLSYDISDYNFIKFYIQGTPDNYSHVKYFSEVMFS